MIKIKVEYNDSYIKNIKVTGHAGYEEKGKDIVCSSVSSIVITSVNLILKMDDKSIKVKEDDGLINVEVLKEDDAINLVLVNMLDMLKELEETYKKYVKII